MEDKDNNSAGKNDVGSDKPLSEKGLSERGSKVDNPKSSTRNS